MRTLIFRTTAPYLTSLMILFSFFILLRGHNEPGGGFIAGLVAASAFAIYGVACGVPPVRRALYFHPMSIAGTGLFLGTLTGLASLFFGVPYFTGLWFDLNLLGYEFSLSTPLIFDVGVYMVVLGTVTSIALGLEERERN